MPLGSMASPQLEELFTAAVEFAQRMLSEFKEFHPFGVSMSPNGKVAMVGGYTGSEHPPSAEILALLQGAFRSQAAEGSIAAAGVCLDVRVVPPGASEKTDAICVRLAEVSGQAMEFYVPYHSTPSGEIEYDDAFTMQANEFVLIAS
jgi:hypothetical protein